MSFFNPKMSALTAIAARWIAILSALTLACAVGIVPFRSDNAFASTSSNLILNGDASASLCSSSGWEETTNPGWTITSGGPEAICYNNTGGFPNSSVPGAQPGNGYFGGGARGSSSLRQGVDVSADASTIDAGTATYNMSGWFGGYQSQNDRADLQATFLSSYGSSLGTSTIGPVTNKDRRNGTKFLNTPHSAV